MTDLAVHEQDRRGEALAAIGAPIAAQLLPGWGVEWIPCTQDQIDQLVPGALAVCDPTPTRELAKVYVVTPWPQGESLGETLWHELTHALLSPLTALVEQSSGAVMTEERIVERLGVLLNRLPMSARRAVVGGVTKWAPRLRARISARAPLARGGQMDPKLVQEALDALIEEGGGDSKCAQILKGLIASAASGGQAPHAEPDGDEGAMAAPLPAEGREGAAPPPMDGAKPGDGSEGYDGRRARKEMNVTPDQKRARQAQEDDAITAFRRERATDELVAHVRGRLPGHSGLPAIERRILAAPDFLSAKAIADMAIEFGGYPSAQRARSGVEHSASPTDGASPPPFSAADLVKEGIPQALAEEIVQQHRANPKLAASSLHHARARISAGTNPFLPKTGANGAHKEN
jgi:hypothetical protein